MNTEQVSSSLEIPGGRFEEQGHTYTDTSGQKVLSVTQVFASLGLINFDFVKKEVLERKSQLGIAVHRAIEILCEGPDALDWSTVDEAIKPNLLAAERWMRETGFISDEREQVGIATVNGMKFGYRFDHKGRILHRGVQRNVILDIKNCATVSPTWAIQTAAYALSQPKVTRGYLRIVLQLHEGKCIPHFYDSREDENAFLYMLFVAIWKMNHA